MTLSYDNRQLDRAVTGFYGAARDESGARFSGTSAFLAQPCGLAESPGRVCKTQYTGSTPVGAFQALTGGAWKDERWSCRRCGCVYTLGLDTIAGAKLLQLKFGAFGTFQPDQAVMHGGRRARFIRMSNGAAIIRHCGSSHPIAVPLEALAFPAGAQDYPALRGAVRADARQAGTSPKQSRLGVRAEGRFPRHHPPRRPLLRH